MPLPRIAIATGDPAGIGPEIALKAALDPGVRKICRPLLFGDLGALETHAAASDLAPKIKGVMRAADATWNDGEVTLVERKQFGPGELHIGAIAAPHGEATLDSAKAAIDAALHASLRRAIKLVTRDRVLHAIRSADSALRRIGIAHPRIAVSGLNPHAGEGGLFGDEEREIIGPAIADANKNDVAAEGPFGADTLFLKKGYDAFVVMIHDQGHIAAKLHAFAGTAALTIGTPVLFSSVAHGSALDIAGKNRGDPGAIISAIRRLAGASRA